MRVRITSLTKYGINMPCSPLLTSFPEIGMEYDAEHIPDRQEPCVKVNGYFIHPDDYSVVNEEVK